MSASKSTCDVFLSYAAHDVRWAVDVEREVTRAGLSVFKLANVEAGAGVSDALWEAIAESAAMIALVSRPVSSLPNLSFEIGAMMAWRKPVYVLFDGEKPRDLPPYIRSTEVFATSDLGKVVERVAKDALPLSEGERQTLVRVYHSLGVGTDQFVTQPEAIERLTRQFNRAAKSHFPGERLVREIIHLRKRGQLSLNTSPFRRRGPARAKLTSPPSQPILSGKR